MPFRLVVLLRDSVFVFLGTVFAGLLIAVSLGESQRGTPLWRLSLTLTIAAISIGVLFVLAHRTTVNRFAYVWTVATISSLPNAYYFFSDQSDNAVLTFFGNLLLMLIYASIGAGLSYAFKKSAQTVDKSVV